MAIYHQVIGAIARQYWRLFRPRTIGVRAVLLDAKDRVALVRHTYIDQWHLPGGGVKKGESIETALVRELDEEIAVRDPRIERILGVYHSRREGKDDHIVIFVARVPDASGDLARADPIEIEDARWFPLDALPVNISPATARRIAEYREGVTGLGTW